MGLFCAYCLGRDKYFCQATIFTSADQRKMDRVRLPGLDALRGYAAVMVLMLHATKIFPITLPYSWNIFLAYCTYGVPLFFVISAFSLAYGYSFKTIGKWKFDFAVKRFFRIAPLFYTMLLAWTLYKAAIGSPSFTFIEYILNLTFTFGLTQSYNLSIVPAGWSIGVEMIFYAFFPFIITKTNSLPLAAAAFAASMLVSFVINFILIQAGVESMLFYWTNLFTNAPYFFAGILAYHLWERLSKTSHASTFARISLFISVSIIICIISQQLMLTRDFNKEPPTIFAVFAWATAFSLLILSQTLEYNKIVSNKLMLFLGQISFSLYLIHPLIIYASGVSLYIEPMAINQHYKGILSWVVAFATNIPLAWITFKLVERPGQKLGKYFLETAKHRKLI